jgi:CDP-glycerol glycerophosphotransferase (TagB/SpsB family)
MTVIGWDNPVSHGIPGARVDYVNVWSKIHVHELSAGLDWPEDRLHIGGMPLYDGYIKDSWLMPRDEYFKEHGLDPDKKLIAYVATALSISPNFHNVEVLINIIKEKRLSEPAQLLIRLHPNHFKPQKHYQEEREKILYAVKDCPDVHVVAPKAVGGGVPRYSGEDFPEKASMLAYCDALVTIYSTMVLEAAIKDRPLISCCIDAETGWPDNFWIPLHEIPTLPTATRVENVKAAVNVFTQEELIKALDAYLKHPELDRENRSNFVKQELTYINGEATRKTADYLLSLLKSD